MQLLIACCSSGKNRSKKRFKQTLVFIYIMMTNHLHGSPSRHSPFDLENSASSMALTDDKSAQTVASRHVALDATWESVNVWTRGNVG